MPAALSTDLGERVAAAIGGGPTARTAARQFRKGASPAIRIGRRKRAGIGRERWRTSSADPGDPERLLVRLASKPDLTMRALTVELAARCVRVAVAVVR